jgi:GNAT superfamily N-acetyltransferase
MPLITVEAPHKLISDGEDLMIDHYREMGLPGVLALDRAQLGRLYQDGVMFPFALRDDGKLIGYAIVEAYPALFNRNLRRAWCEAVYIVPERRGEGLARALVEHVEGFMKAWGIRHISFEVSSTPVLRGDAETAKVGEILASLGYRGTGESWSKRLED